MDRLVVREVDSTRQPIKPIFFSDGHDDKSRACVLGTGQGP